MLDKAIKERLGKAREDAKRMVSGIAPLVNDVTGAIMATRKGLVRREYKAKGFGSGNAAKRAAPESPPPPKRRPGSRGGSTGTGASGSSQGPAAHMPGSSSTRPKGGWRSRSPQGPPAQRRRRDAASPSPDRGARQLPGVSLTPGPQGRADDAAGRRGAGEEQGKGPKGGMHFPKGGKKGADRKGKGGKSAGPWQGDKGGKGGAAKGGRRDRPPGAPQDDPPHRRRRAN